MKTKLNFGEIFNYEGIDLKVVESHNQLDLNIVDDLPY